MTVENIPVAYHFRVDFIGASDVNMDIRFQAVSGLSLELAVRDIADGVNIIKLPDAVKHENLVLTRGLVIGSEISHYFERAMQAMQYIPRTISVTLLNNREDSPLSCWRFQEACPLKWSINPFNSEQNAVAVESMTFSFKQLDFVKV